MKLIKIYLWVVTVLLVIALGFGVYVWYTVQRLDVPTLPQANEQRKEERAPVIPSPASESAPVVIQTDSLTESQQATLKSFGYTGDTITVTAAMVSCAKDAVGVPRFDEILNGSAPTPLESMKLLPCFKK